MAMIDSTPDGKNAGDSTEPSGRHWHAKPVAAVGALGTIAAIIIAIVALPPKQPDLNGAKDLLQSYYATAPTAPEKTWNVLTPALREHPPRGGGPMTQKEYRDYFGQFSSTDVDQVNLSEDHHGWFSARITEHRRDGGIGVRHLQFEILCPKRTRIPLVPCTTGSMRINADTNLPKK